MVKFVWKFNFASKMFKTYIHAYMSTSLLYSVLLTANQKDPLYSVWWHSMGQYGASLKVGILM